MGIRDWLRPRLLDLTMRQMNEMRPETVGLAEGDVIEVGFGTGINLEFYGAAVKSLVAIDPDAHEGFSPVAERMARADFPVERSGLRADTSLPYEDARFDTAVSTWTLCSIPEPVRALEELRRVLRPGGRFVFIEHGRSEEPSTARWQDRLNPCWTRLASGCNMNRSVDRLVQEGGFRLVSLDRFRGRGPGVLAHMYRGVAERAD